MSQVQTTVWVDGGRRAVPVQVGMRRIGAYEMASNGQRGVQLRRGERQGRTVGSLLDDLHFS